MTIRATTKQRILGYLMFRDFVSGSELEKQADKWFTKPSVISRRARELANEGKLERSMSERKTVQYRLVRSMPADVANNYLKSLEDINQEALNI